MRAEGQSLRQIATKLGVGYGTVRAKTPKGVSSKPHPERAVERLANHTRLQREVKRINNGSRA